jgi:hypothetical protein
LPYDLAKFGGVLPDCHGFENLPKAVEGPQWTPVALGPRVAAAGENLMDIEDALVEDQIGEIEWEPVSLTRAMEG